MFEAKLKSRSQPKLGALAVTFPIPEERYENVILALQNLQIGDVRKQDCCIESIRAPDCPALLRMTNTMANVDELDWLGKQLESFDRYELLQFNAAVERFGLSAADELIDLSFCAREVTIISDFKDLELVGKRHYLTVHGACDQKELENLDGEETALALISGQPGYVTRYDYADHSYSYGSWVSDSETQHKRSKTCSACGDSSYEYADHTDANGDGKCDDCGATVSLTIKWDAGTNGGTIDGKASITTTGKTNTTAAAPMSTPIKTGHAFKGWYTSASGGSLYNTVTITAAKTFYAQFTANSYSITWDFGDGTTEETKQTYGEALVLPAEPTRKNAEFLGWFTEANGGTQVDANTVYKTDADSAYYAHWKITEVFSVTVPVTVPLVVDENGEVHTGSAEIINGSTGEVVVSSVSISTKNGWQLVPFDTDMAHEKVDARLLGFKINDSETTKTGDAETFSLTSPWTIAENGKLPLSYDAVVSAVSQPVTEQDVLSVVFVLEWKGE